MKSIRIAIVFAAAVFVLGACSAPERTSELKTIDQGAGYRYGHIEQLAPKQLKDTFLVATFSGGGTRAAALAAGALQGLAATTVPTPQGNVVLADQIDMISSVSGGSVTAGYYGLKGRAGLPELESGFLKKNVQGALIGTALLPTTWFRLATPSYARIDALRDYFDAQVFDHATYQDMLDAAAAKAPGDKAERRPYVVLNASDMTTGTVFPFTQDQFDLICSDLSELHLADAVAASAAFPVALTALTLKNRSPCAAQSAAAKPSNQVISGWIEDKDRDGTHPRPLTVANAIAEQETNPGRFRNGRIALGYLNEDVPRQDKYVQLLDGGITDNLGLTEPLRLMTEPDRQPSILARISHGDIKHIAVVVVNARSEADNSYSLSATPPGVIDTLLTTIGSPIDANSFGLLDSLDQIVNDPDVPEVSITRVPVDFDFIVDKQCRHNFKNIGTNWSLTDGEVDALIELGNAMVRESPAYRKMVADLKGSIGQGPTIGQACATLALTVR